MTLYIGYYRPSAAQWQRFADAEDNGTVEEEQQAFMARVLAARESSFAGNKLSGSSKSPQRAVAQASFCDVARTRDA